jgi:hypothetical protein
MLAETARESANIVLVGILLDAVSQRLILGVAHPGAAVVVGPVLIALPYAFARAVSNRIAQRGRPEGDSRACRADARLERCPGLSLRLPLPAGTR